MYKPIAALIAILLVFVSLVLYDDRSGQVKNGVVEIVYWTAWTGHEFDVQKKLVREFNDSHPKIHARIISTGANHQKVNIAFATGSGPDVCSAVWGTELAGYAHRKVLEPLDSYMRASGRSGSEFMPGVRDYLQYKGHLYALCATTNALFMVYNKKIFRECGLDPNNPPTTIEDLDKAAAAVTKYDSSGEFERYGFRPVGLDIWAYSFGGRWYDPATGKITANDPKNVACLRWMATYSKKYKINKMQSFEKSFGSEQSENASFFTGKQVIWFTGGWVQQFVDRYAKGLDYGFCPIQSAPGGRTNFTPVSGSVFCIPSASRHKKEAWEFLSWICGNHAVNDFCLQLGNIPPLKAVADEPEFQKNPLMKFTIDLAGGKNAIGAVPIPIWATYQGEISRVEDYAIHGAGDPQKLLDDLTVKMQKELDTTLRGH